MLVAKRVLIPGKEKKEAKLVTPRRKSSVCREEAEIIKVGLGCRKRQENKRRPSEFDEEEGAKTSSPFCVA